MGPLAELFLVGGEQLFAALAGGLVDVVAETELRACQVDVHDLGRGQQQ